MNKPNITIKCLAMAVTCLTSGGVGAQTEWPATMSFSISPISEPVEMIFVEGGTFKMGSQHDDPNADNYNPDFSELYFDEGPVHEVSVASFYMAKYEMTNELWCDVLGGDIPLGEDQYAKSHVSWSDASWLINNLNYLLKADLPEGATFALPTEEQWEYAARGGVNHDAYAYAGSDIVAEVAVYNGDSATPGQVGTLKANSLGIYDLSGNALEWTSSYYTSDYSDDATKSLTKHVMRGGGIHTRPGRLRDLRVSGRSIGSESQVANYFGLRLVINLPAAPTPDPSAISTPEVDAPERAKLNISGGRLVISLSGGETMDLCGRRLN